MKRSIAYLILSAVLCGGCTVTGLSFSYARNLACDKLNDEVFVAAQKAKLHTLVDLGFDAGVAAAKEALQCPIK